VNPPNIDRSRPVFKTICIRRSRAAAKFSVKTTGRLVLLTA